MTQKKMKAPNERPLRVQVNLYPTARFQRLRQAIRELTVAATISAVIFAVLGVGAMYQKSQVTAVKKDLKAAEAELKRNEAVINQIAKLREEGKLIKLKVAIINSLRENAALGVKTLDVIADSIDPTTTWLTEISINGRTLTLKGVAADNQTVSNLSARLLQSDLVLASEIAETAKMSGTQKTRRSKRSASVSSLLPPDADLSPYTRFTLTCRLKYASEPTIIKDQN